MKTRYLYIPVILSAIIVLTFSAFQKNSPVAAVELDTKSKIKFSHQLHKEAVECSACHSSVANSKNLNEGLFPKHEDCASCHDVADNDKCSTCHYDNVFETLQTVNTDIIFSHKNHLAKSADCLKCHAGIADDDNTVKTAKYNPEMGTCYTCHGETKTATNACEACHKSVANLVPQNHKVGNYIRSHKFAADAPGANCMMCHDNNSCDECHNATTAIDADNSSKNFLMPYAASQFTDGKKQQRLTRVHEMGYRFTHGIEASGKEKECSSCHQTETFCAECHSGDKHDYALGGMLPMSHRKPNFKTIGPGSGGGEHAVLAKRDIEKCASCHDAQGADPVCVTCHMDNDGARGNDPKTHASGFMKDNDDGDWHSDRGSVCYACHTDANAHPGGTPGQQFCGYCHGKK